MPAVIHSSNDALFEVVAGNIVELDPMGAFETALASVLHYVLHHHARNKKLGRAVMETLFCLNEAADLQRRPDVAFVSYQRWPRSQKIPRTAYWDVVPELAVEIVSPTNSADDIPLKVREYFDAGSKLVWVVFPASEQIYVYASATQVRILTKADTLDAEPVLPGFQLIIAELFDSESE